MRKTKKKRLKQRARQLLGNLTSVEVAGKISRVKKSSSCAMRLKRANEVAHFDDEAQAVESDFSIERRQGAHSWRGDKYF